MILSPLNYTGSKHKLLPQIMPLLPGNINTFVDLFCGGCVVGINVPSNRTLYNDCNRPLIELLKVMNDCNIDTFMSDICAVIALYGLSMSWVNSYEYYGSKSNSGLNRANKTAYMKLRCDLNKRFCEGKTDYTYYVMLYVLIVYSFNNIIRFNSSGEFNMPVGKRDFSTNMQDKLRTFVSALQKQNRTFSCTDFRSFDTSLLTSQDLVYIDPPYLITTAVYNERGGGWREKDERELLEFIDVLNNRGIRFALSNVLKAKGRENELLEEWTASRDKRYAVHHLNYNYSNCNYQRKSRNEPSDEVLVTNY